MSPPQVTANLTKEEEARLGTLVTDWHIFTQRVREGRGAMVCIYLELKDVNGGDSDIDPLEISAYHMTSNAVRIWPEQQRVTVRIAGPLGPEIRDYLFNHSITLIKDDPIRLLLSGYGAKCARRDQYQVRWAGDGILCKLMPGLRLGEAVDGQDPTTEPEAEEPDSQILVKKEVTAQDKEATLAREEARYRRLWFQHIPQANFTQTQHIQPSSSPILLDDRERKGAVLSGDASKRSSEAVVATPSLTSDLAQELRVGQEISGGLCLPSSAVGMDIKVEPPGTPSAKSGRSQAACPQAESPRIQAPRQQSQDTWFETPPGQAKTSRLKEKLRDGAGPSVGSDLSPPSSSRKRSASQDFSKGHLDGKEVRESSHTAPLKRTKAPSDEKMEVQALRGEAEAEEVIHAHVQGDSSVQFAGRVIPQTPYLTAHGGPITSIEATKFNRNYNLLVILTSSAEPRHTTTGQASYSQQIAVVDPTGWLKIMLFASSPHELMGWARPGSVLLLQGILIQHWAGSTEAGKQGIGKMYHWGFSGLSPPSHPSDPSPPQFWGFVHSKKAGDAQQAMRIASDWYHHRGGKEETSKRFRKAKVRGLKWLCDIGAEDEYIDMLGEVVAIFPPENGHNDANPVNKPADVLITDYTSHPETRAAYDQHLGYEDFEYEGRFTDGPGGGMVFRIALWDKQVLAVHGMHVGQYVHIQNIRTKWNADYGISGSVGSADDLNLKVKDGSEHPYLEELLERKKAWASERKAVLSRRNAEEEENEMAWREAHGEVTAIVRPTSVPSGTTLDLKHEASATPLSAADVVASIVHAEAEEARLEEDDGRGRQTATSIPGPQVPKSSSTYELVHEQQERPSGPPCEDRNQSAAGPESERVSSSELEVMPTASEFNLHASRAEADQRELSPPLPPSFSVHLRLTSDARMDPLLSFEELRALSPHPSKPGRLGATYARVRARVIDVMPRDTKEWTRRIGSKTKTTFALLLREEGGEGQEEQGNRGDENSGGSCLPLIIADSAASAFLGLQGEDPSVKEGSGVGDAQIANFEELIGWHLLDQEREEERGQGRVHEWGVAVWLGRKGTKMFSIWGSEIVGGVGGGEEMRGA